MLCSQISIIIYDGLNHLIRLLAQNFNSCRLKYIPNLKLECSFTTWLPTRLDSETFEDKIINKYIEFSGEGGLFLLCKKEISN